MSKIVHLGYGIEDTEYGICISQDPDNPADGAVYLDPTQIAAFIRDLRQFMPECDKSNAERQRRYRERQALKNG